MRADYLTYQRATKASLIGAATQGVMAVALLIYGLKAQDHAAITVVWFMGLGLMVWVALAIVYDQHRRERIENMEAENLGPAGASSVFEAGGGDFKVAAKRLASMYRVFLPVLSLVFGAALVAVGVWRYRAGHDLLEPLPFIEPSQRGWALGLGVAVAAVGFTFARYVSGMAKQTAWANLRAGAGQVVGAALFGLAMLIGHFIDAYGPDAVLRYSQVVFPAVMIVLGGEVFLNFVLDIYRPRKAGEVRRPAFDSRLLSFVAAPDRIAQSVSEAINYQFGYNVSSTWLYQLLARSVTLLVILAMGVAWMLSSAVVVQPHQRALVLRFGEYKREIGPGLHWKLPWPIESVEVPVSFVRNAKGEVVEAGRTVTGVRTVQLAKLPPGSGSTDPILWTTRHSTIEVYFIVQPSPVDMSQRTSGGGGGGGTDAAWLSDLALIAAELPMQYAVRDLHAFELLGDPKQRDEIITLAAKREALRLIKQYNVDQLLGPERVLIAPRLRANIQAALDRLNRQPDGSVLGSGVEVISVGLQGLHPGQEAAAYFEKVVQARQQAEARRDAALMDAHQMLVQAAGTRSGDGAEGEGSTVVDRLLAAMGERERVADDQSLNAADRAARLAATRAEIRDLLEQCGGNVASILAEARAARWVTHMGELAKLREYEGKLASFTANEGLFRAQAFFDAMRASLADARIIVTEDRLRLEGDVDMIEKDTGGRVFTEETEF
ncbi:MAG: hypothetical protein HRU70_06255 [Phycisphaeraceae bacterium]|nr:MAG: hypothetical protein HRU70_06255 [Phycisphaeraceae bacterium]